MKLVFHAEATQRLLVAQRMTWMNLMYPMSTEEPAIAGRGYVQTTTYMIDLLYLSA